MLRGDRRLGHRAGDVQRGARAAARLRGNIETSERIALRCAA
jgi:hypothetical protein